MALLVGLTPCVKSTAPSLRLHSATHAIVFALAFAAAFAVPVATDDGDLKTCAGGSYLEIPADCVHINGSLLVRNSTEPNLPANLVSVRTVSGSVEILDNPGLESVALLHGLLHVGGSLVVSNNSALSSVASGFASVLFVGGDVVISHNPSLRSLDYFLPAINSSVGGTIYISLNPNLSSAGNMMPLIAMIAKDITVRDNPRLVSIGGFNSTQYIGGSIRFMQNAALASVAGFGNLAHVGGEVSLIGSLSLSSIPSFDGLHVVDGSVEVGGTGLVRLAGFMDMLVLVHEIVIDSNPVMQDLDAFAHVMFVNSSFIVIDCPSLTTIRGALSGRTTSASGSAATPTPTSSPIASSNGTAVVDGLVISGCARLILVDAFQRIGSITSAFVLYRLPKLASLSPLLSLREVLVNGMVFYSSGGSASTPLNIEHSFPVLTTADTIIFIQIAAPTVSFPSLQTVHGQLTFLNCLGLATLRDFPALEFASQLFAYGNANLTSVGMFPRLTSLPTGLGFWLNSASVTSLSDVSASFPVLTTTELITIQQNGGLRTLAGFPSLVHAGAVRVVDNPELVTMTAFRNVSFVTTVIITDNPLLTEISGFLHVERASSVYVARLSALQSVTAFPILKRIDGSLFFDRAPLLTNITGFRSPVIDGNLQIFDCPSLESVRQLDGAVVKRGILFSSNDALTSIPSLNSNNESLGERLLLTNMPRLESLAGLGRANMSAVKS
eukprot:Opistho-2@17333